MLLPFSPVGTALPTSVLEACLLTHRILGLGFCIYASLWSRSVGFHRRLCFRWALRRAGCLLAVWVGMAACCHRALSAAPGWPEPVIFVSCILSALSPFSTTVHGKVFWSPLVRKSRFWTKYEPTLGLPWGRAMMLFMKDIFLLPLSSEVIRNWVIQKCWKLLCID